MISVTDDVRRVSPITGDAVNYEAPTTSLANISEMYTRAFVRMICLTDSTKIAREAYS